MSKSLAVLIVEDSEGDAQLLVRLLEKSDYAVVCERVDTAELMRAALTKRTWDVVLADYSLPQFDGRAALATLQAAESDIPFIVVSGTMGEETAVAMMRAGAHDYLTKGELARLVPAVERELAQANARRERRQADAKLRAREQLYRTLLHTAMDGYWLVDTQGHLLEVNEAYCRMSGYSVEELLGLRVSELEAAGAPAGVAEHIQKVMRLREHRFETVHRRKDGSMFDVEIGAQFRSDEGGRLVFFLHDITRRRRAEGEIQQQLDELRRWQAVMLGREDRVMTLKGEVNELARRLGEPVRYPSQEE